METLLLVVALAGTGERSNASLSTPSWEGDTRKAGTFLEDR
jgi:hypothetical protein